MFGVDCLLFFSRLCLRAVCVGRVLRFTLRRLNEVSWKSGRQVAQVVM